MLKSVIDYLNNLQLSSFWEIFWGAIGAFLLVYFVEWLKQPGVEIETLSPLNHPDGRKFLKVQIKITRGNVLQRLFPWKNPATIARLRGELVEEIGGKEVSTHEFTAKWDTRPEPWDYQNNRPRLEFIPFSLDPENLLAGDHAEASVAVKHPNETHFYIFDPNYYLPGVRDNNLIDERLIRLRLTFSSSSISKKRDFVIINRGRGLGNFRLESLK